MKINITPKSKIALLCTAVAGAFLIFSNSVNAVTVFDIGDTRDFGSVKFCGSDRLSYVNHLASMALGTIETYNGQAYSRLTNAFGTLPQAVSAGHVDGIGNQINVGGGGLYTYLFANYSGPNSRSEVWYIGDVSGNIRIPALVGGYALSGWTLFGPGVPAVPDGGTTAMLLGAALGALGMARRFLKI
ncbi:MAG: hypothetical protein DME65_07130 [Verrucomicrobia bacterium]|nr:MAG: hypothetical protein DME65_07130 [Verrucomicrobiota bacterium]